jgi:hypothetical protein
MAGVPAKRSEAEPGSARAQPHRSRKPAGVKAGAHGGTLGSPVLAMPPLATDPEESRPYFRRLRELAETHGLRELSMGTSQDYRVAADEGATLVRVGSVLYGR